jgi:N-acetylglucosamine transport system permease protein
MSRPSVIDPPASETRTSGQASAGLRADRIAVIFLLLGGILGAAQIVLPWFAGDSGWHQYYNTPASGFNATVAAYAILVTLVCGLVMLVSGAALLAMPAATRAIAKAARVAAIVALLCAGWWIALGPRGFSELFGGSNVGWYAFLIAGIAGIIGAGRALAGPDLTFDKVSFMAVFLGLPLVIFVVFVVSPFVQAIYYSMTDWKGFSPNMNFTGLDNYIKLFHDDTFRSAVLNNIKLAIVIPLVTIILALAIASMVTVGGPSRGPVRGIKASSFYRVVSFFPYAVPAIVIGLIWAQVFDPARGILNKLLTGIGLDSYLNFAWLGGKPVSLYATMFVIIWSFVGFYAVLFIASIKGISAEVYEAAKLDGAGRLRTAISVTVPLIRDTIQTAYIYIGIAALDAFVYMVALNPVAGPETIVMSQDLYNTAFRKGQFGYATSMGVVLALVTLLFATLVFLVNRWTGGGTASPKERKRRRIPEPTVAAAATAAPVGQGGRI